MESIKAMAAALPAGKFFDQIYQSVLVPWSSAQGATLSRVPLEASNLGVVCNAVEQAGLIIADISGRNPRVMYVAGYAHGIGKKVIFITQFAEDFPFVLTNQQVVTYSGNMEMLRSELGDGSGSPRSKTSESSARDKFLDLFGDILRKHAYEHRGGVEMENPGTFTLLEQDMDLALVQELSRKARELGIRLKLM